MHSLLFIYELLTLILNLNQGTASVVLAGLLASLKLVGGTLADHTFLFLGAGEVSLINPCLLRISYNFKTKSKKKKENTSFIL